MFTGSAISSLVAHLNRRQASLWHACQLTDLLAYLALGGVPSRSLIERSRLEFTPFVTDGSDRAKGVWDKVFCNLDDFGRSFAAGRRAVPNAYGPVVFQIRPEALLDAADVAVALRSAGAHDFDRETESLSDIAEVDRIFRSPADVGFPQSADIRFGEELAEVFPGTQFEAKSAEVSISHPAELLSLEHVSMVCAEPIQVDGAKLVDVVSRLVERLAPPMVVRERSTGEREEVWNDLVTLLADGALPAALVANRVDVGEPTRRWFDHLRERGLEWQFDRFAAYFYEGTLRHLARPAGGASGTHSDPARHREWTKLPRA